MQSIGCRVIGFGWFFGSPLLWVEALRSWRRRCDGVILVGPCLQCCLSCAVGFLVVWIGGVLSFFGGGVEVFPLVVGGGAGWVSSECGSSSPGGELLRFPSRRQWWQRARSRSRPVPLLYLSRSGGHWGSCSPEVVV